MFDSTTSSEVDILPKTSVVDYKKSQHRRRILTELYRSGTCSIAEMARVIHSSVPSVTSIVEEMVEEKWIVPVGTGVTKQGRKPVLFSLSTERFYSVVLDVNTHDTKILILNLKNEVIMRRDFNLRLEDSPQFLKSLVEATEQVLRESNIHYDGFMAMGVSVAGLVDARKGFNFTYRSLNQNESFGTFLENYFKFPVYVINDTKATTLGEHRFGLAQGKDHVLAIYIDWGVGLGVILNGEVFQGASGFAGELGHIQVVPNGELCHCGKVGCLDTITSAASLIRRIKKGLAEGRISRLSAIEGEKIDAETIIDAAWQGDSFAIDILHEIGMELGKGLSIAIHLFNPEIIIVDGIVAKAGAFITNPIEQAINKYCLTDFRNNLTVVISQLGQEAKWLGTQAYVVEKVIESI
ncbi:ROK family protein [Runella sp. CRIBMP]|uniref:ROK family transcriptional regulator n=2 Tax=Runella TaxID=105 RepID=A0A369ICX0_9BACT|nr:MULTISPECIES: ROK family transcriptional regulator [Runella]MCP1382942.1 ROK family protein [Runella salmonicolor]NBB22146.1 ROK family protein [Runella sp. CRIBMP]RDB07508.1 ROK family transcriptional regulator [Runella aurantiaca]